jgi:hypothetical protein
VTTSDEVLAAADRQTLRICLQAAVPLWVARLRAIPLARLLARANDLGEVIGCQGDMIEYRERRGKTAAAFNSLAEGIAALSFAPGGVTFLGDHWESEHPESARGPKGVRSSSS